ncbi:MAG: hypothetical protein EAZ40_02785 [Rhodobacterales bacterium]|nr:MAG: hypothetical protein EAZ40_02785 [Rhodobacterales bacterium]
MRIGAELTLRELGQIVAVGGGGVGILRRDIGVAVQLLLDQPLSQPFDNIADVLRRRGGRKADVGGDQKGKGQRTHGGNLSGGGFWQS